MWSWRCGSALSLLIHGHCVSSLTPPHSTGAGLRVSRGHDHESFAPDAPAVGWPRGGAAAAATGDGHPLRGSGRHGPEDLTEILRFRFHNPRVTASVYRQPARPTTVEVADMFSKRRSAWEPEGYDQDPDQDLDWGLEDEGSEWDRYLDWVPGDERPVPKFKFPVVLPVVFGLVIGLAIAAQSSHTTFMQQAFGGHRHHQPRPVSSPSFHRHHGGRPTPAPTTPAGNPAALDCTITVPENPLSARGLATPYRLGGGCSEANTNLQAFVQATILDPVTGAVAVYNPLVITAGTTPAAAPVVTPLPRDAVGDLLFGFNGNILTQVGTGDSLREGNCVTGLPSSPFGQVGYCNAGAF